ncbi:MAG TPA: thiamine pyrophosphate-binding protein [Alphaproteobacteria bacterium]|nr:thiamine pyrophosphate-binding protein [Alphaproteobacteria bacterium]
MATNTDLIVRMLKRAGIGEGFGIPSGNVIPLIESMRGGGMRFVLTAHEGSAAFAADVMGRMTGRPGLCIATHGPGATNLTTGVGCAYLDRSPLLAITCNIPTAQLGRRVQMHIPHHDLFAPITKASLELRPGGIATTIAEAVRLALTEPVGPVHLDLPEDVAIAETNETEVDIPPAARLSPPSREALAEARKLIGRARRPIAVIGASAMRMREPALLRRFLEAHAMPFATTTMAKGLVNEDHKLSLGCIERARRQVQREMLRSADLIIGLGYDTIEVEYEAWIKAVPLLHIDIARADVDASVRVAHEVVGDLDAALEALAAGSASNEWTPAAISAHRERFQASLRPRTAEFSPHQAIDVVRAGLPKDGVLAFDVGAHTHQIGSQWTAHAPRTFLITNGWSSMGFGLPAAIAAKLARPDLPVVAVIGDGCFQMTCGEVAVAKRYGLALPIVVLDDRWLALIKVKQQRRNFALYGTELQEEPYTAPPAHYFGVPAVGARTPDELAGALKKALATDGPTVIEAVVDASHYTETVYD